MDIWGNKTVLVAAATLYTFESLVQVRAVVHGTRHIRVLFWLPFVTSSKTVKYLYFRVSSL